MDFYSAMAQVLPVLLLAVVWDSRFLDRLGQERRPARKADGSRDWFWTKPKVRAYGWFVTAVIVLAIALTALVLAELLPDGPVPKFGVLAALVLTLGTLLTRLWVDIYRATEKLEGE